MGTWQRLKRAGPVAEGGGATREAGPGWQATPREVLETPRAARVQVSAPPAGSAARRELGSPGREGNVRSARAGQGAGGLEPGFPLSVAQSRVLRPACLIPFPNSGR